MTKPLERVDRNIHKIWAPTDGPGRFVDDGARDRVRGLGTPDSIRRTIQNCQYLICLTRYRPSRLQRAWRDARVPRLIDGKPRKRQILLGVSRSDLVAGWSGVSLLYTVEIEASPCPTNTYGQSGPRGRARR